MVRRRFARITLIDPQAGLFKRAQIIGAGWSQDGLAFLVRDEHGDQWIGQDEIAEIVYDPCGTCGRAIVEDDGYPVNKDETWHLDCAMATNPNA